MAHCSFASWFLNLIEDSYYFNELEFLGVVWSIEHFKYYLYGKQFQVITDHRALLSTIRENSANKSYNSPLTLWFDKLSPFDFTIDHLPGSEMGLVDYSLQEPQQKAVNISTYVEQFIVAKLDAIKRSAYRFLLNAENYTDFGARNPPIKAASNNRNFNDKLCSEFAPRCRENSTTAQNGNTIIKLTPNNSNSNAQPKRQTFCTRFLP